MIEYGAEPGRSVVAGGAIRGESCLDVVGIAGRFEILGVAGVAIRRSAFEFSADVTCGAFERDVSSGEGESGEL